MTYTTTSLTHFEGTKILFRTGKWQGLPSTMIRSAVVIAVIGLLASPTVAFQTSPHSGATSTRTSTRLHFFGAPKDDGSPGDYLCKDCGYVFTKGPAVGLACRMLLSFYSRCWQAKRTGANNFPRPGQSCPTAMAVHRAAPQSFALRRCRRDPRKARSK